MLRVVLADDEKKVIFLLRELIDWEKLGFEIVGVAGDGLSALDQIARKKPQLLVTDIRMPGCSGLELIRRARELQPGMHCIIISGYREFEYAQSALKYGVEDYLLKPLKKEELVSLLVRLRERMGEEKRLESRIRKNEENRQERLLSALREHAGRGIPFPDAAAVNEEYGFRFSEGVFYAVLVRPDISEAAEHPESYRVLLRHSLDIVRKNIPGIAEEFAVFSSPEGIAAVLNTPFYDVVDVTKCLTKIRREIEQQRDLFWDIRTSVSIGSRKTSVCELPFSMKEALWLNADRLFAQRTQRGALPMRDAQSEKIDENLHYQMDPERRNRLQSAVELLDVEKFEQALEDSYKGLLYMSDAHGTMAEEWFRGVFRICAYGPGQGTAGADSFGGDSFYEADLMERFWCAGSLEEAYTLLRQSIGDRIRALKQEKIREQSRPILAAMRYIQDNYSRAMRLEDVSDYVGFNATYFSTLFKKETGMHFSDYLARVRVEHAKSLLLQEELSIMDVCEQIGYKDLKYFSRLFKKQTGINPSDYRKLYR